jgi:hypothetical protein
VTLRKAKRPGSRRHLPWTPAQQVAFRVFHLRALWEMAHVLDPDLRDGVQDKIDVQIMRLGYESQGERHIRVLAEAVDEPFEDVPF